MTAEARLDVRVLTAASFIGRLEALQSSVELDKIQRYFKIGEGEYGEGDTFIGVRMGQVFALATEFMDMQPAEIETLLESHIHEARAGAVKIMARQVIHKNTSEARRRELFELYLRRHDRINNWDLVDLGAWDVVGRHLIDKPRDVLYELARSTDVWERRTAIYSTVAFIRRGEVDDSFRIAEILLDDEHDLIHKATGGTLRFAGDIDRPRLLRLLDDHGATMPRTALRYAIEHLEAPQRARYLGLRKADIGRSSRAEPNSPVRRTVGR